MRLYKSRLFSNRLTNPETGDSIGKCTGKDTYWYYDINCQLIKKDTFKFKYWL